MCESKSGGIELYCPVCHELLHSEKELLEHYAAKHESKEKEKEVGEEVAGAIEVSEKSFFGGVNMYLIFASSKILGAKTNPKINSVLSPFLAQIPSLLLIGRQKTSRESQGQVLTAALETKILEDDPKNFVLPYSEIEKVELKKYGRLSTGELEITTTSQKHLDFRLVMLPTARDETFDLYQSLLKSKLQEKLIIRE